MIAMPPVVFALVCVIMVNVGICVGIILTKEP